jgi:hypothetical protein
LRLLTLTALVAVLIGCGGGGGSSAPASVSQPTPAPPPSPDVVSGVAAEGAALTSSSVSVTDANGASVAATSTTDATGAFQIEVPRSTTYPITLVVTSSDGGQLRTVVAEQPSAAGSSLTANLNPITELATSAVLEENGGLAGLTNTAFSDGGARQVSNLLGAAVDFEDFASDGNFVAASGDSSSIPSVADTLIDALQKGASRGGQALSAYIAERASVGAKLLEQPKMQVRLVGLLLKAGNSPDELEEKLTAAGALTDDAAAAATTLRAAIVAVPAAIARSQALSGEPNEDLEEAVVEVLATMAEVRAAQGGASAVASMLSNEGVQQTVAAVMNDTVKAFLEEAATSIASDGDDASAAAKASATSAVASTVGEKAGLVVATMDDASAGSAEGAAVAAAVVSATIVPASAVEAITVIASGSGVESAVRDPGASDTLQAAVTQQAASQGSTIVTAPVPGRWSTDSWGSMTWGN